MRQGDTANGDDDDGEHHEAQSGDGGGGEGTGKGGGPGEGAGGGGDALGGERLLSGGDGSQPTPHVNLQLVCQQSAMDGSMQFAGYR